MHYQKGYIMYKIIIGGYSKEVKLIDVVTLTEKIQNYKHSRILTI